MMAVIREFQEKTRLLNVLVQELKDDVEEIERLGDSEEYEIVRAKKMFDLYNRIDDLSDAIDDVTKWAIEDSPNEDN